MADFTPILDYCTCKFTPIQAYLQIFPPSIFHQIPPQTKTPRIKLAFLHGVTTDVFLLNTDYTDFTDNLVLPHNGTKASSLDAPPNKNIRVIREIRVQKPYASRINKEYPRPQKLSVQSVFRTLRITHQQSNPCNPCNPCSEPLRITEVQGISTFSESIREIRVQPPYAPRLNKDIRVQTSPPTVLKQELSTAS